MLIEKKYPAETLQSPHPIYTPSQFTTIPHTPFTQLNKCGALLNGPHFSPAPAAPAAPAAASDPDTKAPQKLFKLPINLFQSSRKQMTKKGEWLKGASLFQLWLSCGYTGLLINRPILTTEYQSPPPYVLRTFTRHLPCTPLSHN